MIKVFRSPKSLLLPGIEGRTLIQMGEYGHAEEALKTALQNAIGSKYGRDSIPLIEVDLEQAKAHIIETVPHSVVIYGDNNAPINNGGIQATDDAILNRPVIMSEPDIGWTVPIDQTIEKPEERDPGDTKPTGIISRIFKKETCVKCGASIQKDQIYCNKCGRKLE